MSARGHVLVEVMVSAAVLLMAVAGIAAGLAKGAADAHLAAHDEMALHMANLEREQLLAQPASGWLAVQQSHVLLPCPGLMLAAAHCAMTVDYSGTQPDAYDGGPVGVRPAVYMTADVSVAYCTGLCPDTLRTVTVQAARYLDP